MKQHEQGSKRKAVSLVLATTLLAGLGWSDTSHACAVEPYISSVCVMAWPKNPAFGGGVYMAATGTQLSVSNYQALYALIGTTYGGTSGTNFNLPDLRGRMVIGVGQNPQTGGVYDYGQKSGTISTTLTVNNLPPHAHTLTKVAVTSTLGTMAATTTLNGLSASTTMAGVTGSISGSSLMLNGSNGGNLATSPSNATLGTYTATTRIYSDAAPTVAMKAGSISGSANVAFSGNPTTTISGNPTTSLTGAPNVSIGGATDVTGAGQSFSTISPYLAMPYYIAVNGIFPTPD